MPLYSHCHIEGVLIGLASVSYPSEDHHHRFEECRHFPGFEAWPRGAVEIRPREEWTLVNARRRSFDVLRTRTMDSLEGELRALALADQRCSVRARLPAEVWDIVLDHLHGHTKSSLSFCRRDRTLRGTYGHSHYWTAATSPWRPCARLSSPSRIFALCCSDLSLSPIRSSWRHP
ncbi:hypothetical protein OH76DRAFT_1094567 [Lentinus brumalis]|uniref:Uncharacterized protein n=1 Tax=Lentinus brumalis TaxID=2498619 RepID=A0A371CW11_9APHY|nr:hypothetical protein OH76DRAFT_1094567 [Polyporus brumalis]